MAAMPPGLGHSVGGCPAHFQGAPPPAHPHTTSLLPAPSLGSWSSPKFPGAPTHAGRSVAGAPSSPAGHPPRAPTRECRGPANSAACAARASPDPPEACPVPPPRPPRGPPGPNSPRGGGGGGARARDALRPPGCSGKRRCGSIGCRGRPVDPVRRHGRLLGAGPRAVLGRPRRPAG